MDNAMIERLYNRGIRAYVSDRGNYFDEPPIDPDDPDDGGATPFAWAYKDGEEMWHALRAYQDAERKKGTQIKMYIGEWHHRDYKWPEGTNVVFCLTAADEPRIYLMSKHTEVEIGKFTNFRWRAGYPKGGQNG